MVGSDFMVKDLVKDLVSIDYTYCERHDDPQWVGGIEILNPLDKYCLIHDQNYRYCKIFQENREEEILQILQKYLKI